MKPTPLDVLLDASQRFLEDVELAALNRASNLGKDLRKNVEAYADELAEAMLARWLLDNREALRRPAIEPKRMDLFDTEKHARSA